jgi:Ni,Fe-hydrogenase III large subunit
MFGTAEGLVYSIMGKYGSIELLCAAFPKAASYPSLSSDYPAFSVFERLLFEEYGVKPEGHPWLKAVRKHLPGEESHSDYQFLNSASSALHEVGVGPVHAGVIEPGHFRFICKGEIVEHLEIQLGFQHRNVEQLILKSDIAQKSSIAECIAGDTAIGHSLAYCLLLEKLGDTIPAASGIRNIALELERVAMHLSGLSALAGDVAYILGQNLFAALRTTVINSSLAICGSRFGKRWLRPGGVNYGISQAQAETLQKTLSTARQQIIDSAEAMFANSSVLSRFDDTGMLKLQDALTLGLTGITAKASGLVVDARMDYPLDETTSFLPISESSGDVYARANLRYLEILQSLDIIFKELAQLDTEAVLHHELGAFLPDSIAIAIVEGWRGRIIHIAKTDSTGRVIWYKILDPSFTNWQALALVMRGTGISDFPICNKSFNLSYCGHDL